MRFEYRIEKDEIVEVNQRMVSCGKEGAKERLCLKRRTEERVKVYVLSFRPWWARDR